MSVVIRKIRDEAAAVIVLVALSIFVLIAIVALAIDVALLSAASEQGRQFARLASLTAIEEYFAKTSDPDVPCDHLCGMAAARDRVNSVAELNLLFSDRRGAPPLVMLETDPGCPDGSSYCAVLQPGRWIVDEDEAGSEACQGSFPCFSLEIDPEESTPNAFRISGQFHQSITTRLASVFLGASSVPSRVAATSSFVPRRGCFLVDVSPTIVGETHVGWWGGGPFLMNPPAGELSVEDPPPNNFISHNETCLDAETCGPDPAGGAGPLGNRYAFTTRTDNPEEFLSYFPPMDLGWLALEQLYPVRPGAFRPDQHFADDYQPMFLLHDDDYPTGGELTKDLQNLLDYHPSPDDLGGFYAIGDSDSQRRWARVDTYPDNEDYFGPQPLATFMEGIRDALEEFGNRQVAGDEACLIFFDSGSITWPRVVNLTSNFDYLRDFLDFSTGEPGAPIPSDQDIFGLELGERDVEAAALVAAGGPRAIGSGRLRSIRHHIMPLRAAHTDIRLGLQEALAQLRVARDTGPPASEFVVLITDGLQNCKAEDCQNTYEYYAEGMQAIYDQLQAAMEERRVPIHVLFEGAVVGPHTVDVYKGPREDSSQHPIGQTDDCYTDDEYRASDLIGSFGFVEGQGFDIKDPHSTDAATAFSRMSDDEPFYQANLDWYKVAVITRGVWGPLRERDDQFCDGYFSDGPLSETGGKWLSPRFHRPFCEASDSDSTPVKQKFDRYCRPKSQQINDYLRRIVGENPYTVVEVR